MNSVAIMEEDKLLILQDWITSPSVEFISSRCFDLVAASHLLVDCSHHGFASKWATELRTSLNEAELEALETIGSLPLEGLELAGLCCVTDDLNDTRAFVEYVGRTAPEEFLFWALGRKLPLRRISECYGRLRSCDELAATGGNVFQAALLRDPLRFRDAAVLVWAAISEAVVEKALSVEHLTTRWCAVLSDRFQNRKEPIAEFAVKLAGDEMAPTSQFGVWYVVSSWFLSPHRLRWSDLQRNFVAPDWQELDEDAERCRAEYLGRVVGALADTNRLMIMRELARARCSGRTLAPRLGVTPATMSHHLDVLCAAGLVTRESAQNGQVYAIDLNAVDAAVNEVKAYLSYGTRDA